MRVALLVLVAYLVGAATVLVLLAAVNSYEYRLPPGSVTQPGEYKRLIEVEGWQPMGEGYLRRPRLRLP